jgi:hypothetical protein
VIGTYAVLAIVAPWVSMLAIYGWKQGWTLMGLYTHLFWYPLFFGIVQMCMLTRLVQILLRLRIRQAFTRVAVPFSIAAVIVGGYIEVDERPALFELKPSVIEQPIRPGQAKTLIEHLANPAPADTTQFQKDLPPNSLQIRMDVDGLRLFLDDSPNGSQRKSEPTRARRIDTVDAMDISLFAAVVCDAQSVRRLSPSGLRRLKSPTGNSRPRNRIYYR